MIYKNLNMKKSMSYQMKRSVLLPLITAFILVITLSSASALFMGITDGYVKDVNGTIIAGATITVTVTSCSGGASNGCTGSALSDSDGYYITNNLNLPKLGGITLSAVKGAGTGSASGTADSFQIAHANASVCFAPSAPALTAVSDSHNTTLSFSWTSGSDYWGRTIHDKFDLDGTAADPAVSPVLRIVSFATHTWKAATCNAYCCSGWTSDVFITENQAPSAPTHANDSVYGTITSLNWTSGIDPEGDPTYDEFEYQNGSIVSLVTPPYNVTTELLVRWAVRTCDNNAACSNWTWTDSITCSGNTTSSCATCPTCGECPSGGSGGGGGGCRKVAMTCNGIPIGKDLLLAISLQLGPNAKKITIKGVNTSLQDLEYCPWCYNGKKDYDETGVDCGGNCKPCAGLEVPLVVEKPFPTTAVYIATIVALVVVIVSLIVKLLKSKKQREKKGKTKV